MGNLDSLRDWGHELPALIRRFQEAAETIAPSVTC
jgi:hypothetical protein